MKRGGRRRGNGKGRSRRPVNPWAICNAVRRKSEQKTGRRWSRRKVESCVRKVKRSARAALIAKYGHKKRAHRKR